MIVFISDNGARFIQTVEGADNPNFPLKGFKNTIYEGGARVPGFVHSPLLEKPRRRHQGLFHMVDFLPTLVNLAGGVVPSSLDGVDQWPSLSLAQPSPRAVVVYNIDDVFVPTLLAGPVIYQKFQIGLRSKRYKLIWGQSSMLHRGYRKPQYSKAGVVTEFQVELNPSFSILLDVHNHIHIPSKRHHNRNIHPQSLQLYDLVKDPGEVRNTPLVST